MRIAVVAGGWHYPLHLYRALAAQADMDVELFCIGHRSPDVMEVHAEKQILETLPDSPLVDLDRTLYENTATSADMELLGWSYHEAVNTVGDWEYLNQWLSLRERVGDFEEYGAILFAHDDTYIRRGDLFPHIREIIEAHPETLLWTNGRYPEAPLGYARGSFEIFQPKLIEMLGGRIPMADTGLDRTGKIDTPDGLGPLSPWNANGEPLRHFMNARGLKVGYMSQFYRVSQFAIEGERGFLHKMGGAPWSYNKGLTEMGVIA